MGDTIGCDVSKLWIDVAVAGTQQTRRIANQLVAIERLAAELAPGSTVAMEATGQMHELLADAMFAQGHTVFVLNPRWVHIYGKGVGIRGKTDQSDAALIARFAAAEASSLHPYIPPSAEQRELRSLLLKRREAVKLRAAAAQSLGSTAASLGVEFNKVVAKIDRQVKLLIDGNSTWRDLARRLRTQPGVGAVVAAHLVQVLTRTPFRNASALVAHTGLDPRPNDSGQKRGRRRLTCHGDSSLRTMLFMAAMTACRKPEWRAIYDAQRTKGLASTAAHVVVARKLARIAFCLFRNGGIYDAQHVKMI